ncbi:3-keto-5-aminohexanoate cleavage protein [Acetobacter sp. TBRC 12305]|uniref:3-keto-5-aminohexanoate cleavage protein n=1 Tax=Acetobacter garciniae TaxID=2817435 RepID=A0A939HQ02_9PROT|nr:3-keto-5-aminohexanoate cleavage protein [Acetobacter garciniae]MBO1326114.1 3-keto-5-aminohexanoate cleavage protein [Acetobacter garciniae]MBX0345142.1 3-keto-5-aminohexanoate cleavage protein [Acetobacter garciniae]
MCSSIVSPDIVPPHGGAPCVIAVAITGSVPRKSDNPTLPVTPSEQIESTHQAFEAGATLVHIHVRNADETPSSDPALFAAVQEGVQRHCPGMIVQFSTGGRGRDPSQRGSALYLRPDMASLSTGSVNFPTIVYENGAALVTSLASSMKTYDVAPEIEIFDLSHIHGARRLIDAGLMGPRPHVQFVLGVKNAMPADEHLLDILLAEKQRILPDATWTAAGIGQFQTPVMDWALARKADAVRTGLEDNIRITRDRLARGNAELVQIACERLAAAGRAPATPAQARQMLGLRPVAEPAAGTGQHAMQQEAVSEIGR